MVHSTQQGTRPATRATRSTHVENMRRSLRQLFTGTSVVETTTSPEAPKTPRLELAPRDLPSTRIILPHLARAATAPTTLSRANSTTSLVPSTVNNPNDSAPITPHDMQRAMSLPQLDTRSSRHPFVGVDPEERYLADLATRGRRRQSKRTRGSRRGRSCVLNFRDRKIRTKILACCLSGIFLLVILTIYLALALSNRDESQEFHVLLILIILLTTIFFCHSLISLCMVVLRAPNEVERPRMSLVGPGGFANPPRPIRVALARDEEAVGIESEATKFPPPAYGLWRESVRVDPNRIYWQRAETARARSDELPASHTRGTSSRTQRPPSYVSEDGVAYVIEAAPRSIAPTADVPLPLHPSERGRVHNPSTLELAINRY